MSGTLSSRPLKKHDVVLWKITVVVAFYYILVHVTKNINEENEIWQMKVIIVRKDFSYILGFIRKRLTLLLDDSDKNVSYFHQYCHTFFTWKSFGLSDYEKFMMIS